MARILIIDDDPLNRELLTVRLQAAGHDPVITTNGEDGLAAAGSGVDLILLDVMMPRLDGWAVCRALKNSRNTMNIPVIMLTACGSTMEQLRGFEVGAADYVSKPWDPKALMETIEKNLAVRSATGDPQ